MEGDEATGERAQEFRAVRRLGGGQSRTWLATDPEGRWVVLKRLPDGADALGRARFVREASILQRLDGIPGTSRLIAVGDELGEPWIALRALPFESAATLAPGALRPDEIAAMGAHLGETLDAAHRCGVVHRDVTPANVVLADVPALIDWGSAVADGVVLDGTLRGLDAWVGTPRFTPPEARSGGAPPSPATDVFGLGATLASLLGPGSPSAGALRDLCDAATDPDPARRPSMGALSAALAALAASAEAPVRAASWGSPDAVVGDAVGPASAAGAAAGVAAGVAARGTRRDGRAAVRSHVAALRRAAAEAAELTTVRLTGPAGGGKTWLLAAAADDAMRDGWRVWHATCAPGITDVRALDPWLRDADGAETTTTAAASADFVDRSGHALAERAITSEAIMTAIERSAPVLCLLDDVHLADDDLVEVLGELAAQPCRGAVVLAAGRDLGPDADDLDAAALALDRLDDDEVAAIATARLGRALTASERDAIVAAAQGNALHAEEATRALRRDGRVSARGLVELISDRLDHLPRVQRDLLDLGAQCGLSFWPEVIGPPESLHTAALIEEGLAVASAHTAISGCIEIRLAHPLIQETAVAALDGASRTRGAARLTRALVGRDAPPSVSVRVAVPAVDGGEESLRPIAIDIATRAGHEAIARLAIATAARHAASAQRLTLGDAPASLDLLAADVAILSGTPALIWDRLAVHLDAPDAVGTQARALAHRAAHLLGEFERAEVLGEQVLAELEPGSAAWARAAAVHAQVLSRRGREDEACDLALQAAACMPADDAHGKALALVTAALASSELDWRDARDAIETGRLAARAEVALRRAGRRSWVHHAATLVEAMYPTDWDAAWRLGEDAAAAAIELDDRAATAALSYFSADFALERGDLASIRRWLGVFAETGTATRWAEDAARTEFLLQSAVDIDAIPDLTVGWRRAARRQRAMGDATWGSNAIAAALPYLWVGRPQAHAELLRGFQLDLSASAAGRGALMMRAIIVGEEPPPLTVGRDAELDELALSAYLRGDTLRADALVRRRAAGHSADRPRCLRLDVLGGAALVWGLGPIDTDPPIEWCRRWIANDDLPGYWAVVRVMIEMLFVERGIHGFSREHALARLRALQPEPEVGDWIEERLLGG